LTPPTAVDARDHYTLALGRSIILDDELTQFSHTGVHTDIGALDCIDETGQIGNSRNGGRNRGAIDIQVLAEVQFFGVELHFVVSKRRDIGHPSVIDPVRHGLHRVGFIARQFEFG